MADNAQRPRPPPNRRRDKVQLSCDPCKHRKLRCDRHQPCGACSRRGLTNSCNYATTSSSTPDAQRSVGLRQSTNLHSRISELESLVVTLMEGQSLPTPPPASKSPRPSSLSFTDVFLEIRRPKASQAEAASPADPGTLKLRESGTSYVQSAHWEAILTKVRGLKEDLVTDSKAPTGSHLFYGPSRHATRDEILAAVPPRPVVDRLVALHFDSYIITPYLIHSKKFLREYEMFWEDPSTTSIAWIGLMFSMLCIAAQLQAFTIDFTDGRAESLKAEYLTMKDAFREKAVQCLILARYTTGGPYILETLITILTGEFLLLKDSATDGWLLISMILHLAMRMGYHRDPDHFPGISPFEGEIRRRIWTTIIILDLALSLEMGLPRSATDTHIDTKLPCNLLDSDFEELTTEMPPPRPETEWTPVLPLIAKGRLISALGLICDVNTDIKPPSYDEIIKVDALLEDVHNRAIPPVLRWQTMPHPITDSPNLVIQRVSVEMSYYKSRILLYRRALIGYPLRQSQEWDKESVRICLDSALKILSFQQMLHEESQPFGRLYQLRWKVAHIFNQDVLLATSVLCLYLQDVDKFELPATAGQTTWSPRAEEIRQRLTISHTIWLQMSTTSAEAGKVAKALSIVLGNTEASAAEDGSGSAASYDFLTDFDSMPLNGFGASSFNNQYFPSAFYAPLTFFDNVLETGGT
ncbi:putative Zn(II)2Cys6 transcription factor [Mollisia scopiformis]|uniref:Putative Zn(II)2Cys6 transcription factor n=1 Tax=Mollisia scopiformis TaxID=149040 RepID=A0A132B641_MOLSC|nr:putative Zn(II)2Cys6 transcription factor [Mollisia scopiformis]KUJ07723.1 putative Zn(II)2Cys6 transcription factor [Mollisia scopiformis]